MSLAVHATRPWIDETREYIERNLSERLSVEALAQRSGCSTWYFARAFRAQVGEPPLGYLRRLRLERAAKWLRFSGLSITQIAFASGYGSHEAFTRAFAAHFGVAPLRYRTRAARDPGDAPPLRVARLPARRVAVVRHVGPYDSAERAFERLAEWARPRGLLGGSMFFLYWDDQEVTPPERTRCDAALVVGEDAVGERDVAVRSLPACECAVFRHGGSPDERRRLYQAAYRAAIPALGRVPAGAPPFEVHPLSGRGVDYGVTDAHLPLRSR